VRSPPERYRRWTMSMKNSLQVGELYRGPSYLKGNLGCERDNADPLQDICGEAFMLTSSRRVQVKVKTPPFFMAIVGCDWLIIAMEIGGSHGIAEPKGFGGPS